MIRWTRLVVSLTVGTVGSMAGFAIAQFAGLVGGLVEAIAPLPSIWIIGWVIKILMVLTRSNRFLYGWAYWMQDYFSQSPWAIGLPVSIFLCTLLSYWLIGLHPPARPPRGISR